MWIHKRSGVVEYCYTYSSHTQEDGPYREYVQNLVAQLYGLKPYVTTNFSDSCTHLCYFSKPLVMFKIKLGLPFGKKGQITMPTWITRSDALLTSCIRGIFDTDGSVTFKKKHRNRHYYPILSLHSKSKALVNQLQLYLEKYKISSWIGPDAKSPRRPNILWGMFVSGAKNLKRFETNIGFRNIKHLTKIEIWKEFGFCPPYTSLKQRLSILNGRISPNLSSGRG